MLLCAIKLVLLCCQIVLVLPTSHQITRTALDTSLQQPTGNGSYLKVNTLYQQYFCFMTPIHTQLVGIQSQHALLRRGGPEPRLHRRDQRLHRGGRVAAGDPHGGIRIRDGGAERGHPAQGAAQRR